MSFTIQFTTPSTVSPDTPPTTPDPMDDEGNGSSTVWSWNNQGGMVTSSVNGNRILMAPAGDASWHHLYQSLPATPNWEFRAKMSGLFPTNIFHAMMSVRNSSTEDFIAFGRSYAGAYFAPLIETWTSNTAFNGNSVLFNSYWEPMQNPYYVSIQYSAPNLTFLWSGTGEVGTFVNMLTQSTSSFIGAGMDQICLSLYVNDGSVPGTASLHWFRRIS